MEISSALGSLAEMNTELCSLHKLQNALGQVRSLGGAMNFKLQLV